VHCRPRLAFVRQTYVATLFDGEPASLNFCRDKYFLRSLGLDRWDLNEASLRKAYFVLLHKVLEKSLARGGLFLFSSL
jgi:hypothetical protein